MRSTAKLKAHVLLENQAGENKLTEREIDLQIVSVEMLQERQIKFERTQVLTINLSV